MIKLQEAYDAYSTAHDLFERLKTCDDLVKASGRSPSKVEEAIRATRRSMAKVEDVMARMRQQKKSTAQEL